MVQLIDKVNSGRVQGYHLRPKQLLLNGAIIILGGSDHT